METITATMSEKNDLSRMETIQNKMCEEPTSERGNTVAIQPLTPTAVSDATQIARTNISPKTQPTSITTVPVSTTSTSGLRKTTEPTSTQPTDQSSIQIRSTKNVMLSTNSIYQAPQEDVNTGPSGESKSTVLILEDTTTDAKLVLKTAERTRLAESSPKLTAIVADSSTDSIPYTTDVPSSTSSFHQPSPTKTPSKLRQAKAPITQPAAFIGTLQPDTTVAPTVYDDTQPTQSYPENSTQKMAHLTARQEERPHMYCGHHRQTPASQTRASLKTSHREISGDKKIYISVTTSETSSRSDGKTSFRREVVHTTQPSKIHHNENRYCTCCKSTSNSEDGSSCNCCNCPCCPCWP